MVIKVGAFQAEDGNYYCITHPNVQTKKIPTNGKHYDIICEECEWVYKLEVEERPSFLQPGIDKDWELRVNKKFNTN
jgi:hypothetical protein